MVSRGRRAVAGASFALPPNLRDIDEIVPHNAIGLRLSVSTSDSDRARVIQEACRVGHVQAGRAEQHQYGGRDDCKQNAIHGPVRRTTPERRKGPRSRLGG